MCKGGGFPCYAYRLANTRLKETYLANKNTAPTTGEYLLPNLGLVEMNPFYPRFWPDRLYIPFNSKPKGIFTVDMGELFGDWIPREWQDDIFRVIKLHPNDRFYLLTKQPQNLAKFSPFPDNVYIGVTATEQYSFVRAVSELRFIAARIKYLSFEPLLGHIPMLPEALRLAGINWLIIGSQTKPTVYPKLEWVKEIVQAADRAGAAVFLKDNLKPLIGNQVGTWRATPAVTYQTENEKGKYGLKQELPK